MLFKCDYQTTVPQGVTGLSNLGVLCLLSELLWDKKFRFPLSSYFEPKSDDERFSLNLNLGLQIC